MAPRGSEALGTLAPEQPPLLDLGRERGLLVRLCDLGDEVRRVITAW